MPRPGPKICLNMIVKNEMANLERCLASVVDHIACWVICDTGSSDGTPDFIISFFEKRNVAGELHRFPFENFSQARNRALDLARASVLAFDYILLVDADMEFAVADPASLHRLTAPAYHLRQSAGIVYWNVRLLRRDVAATYKGVTHEYIDLRGAAFGHLQGAGFIDHASGANRAGKFDRDAELLRTALVDEKDAALVARYTFYLANTLRDGGDASGALSLYLRRAELGYWQEEIYVSLLNAARLKERLRRPDEEVIAAYSEAAETCPTRAEALHGAARFCRDRRHYERGYTFAKRGLGIPAPGQALFSEPWIYDVGLSDEFAINAYWTGRYAESAQACRDLLRKPELSFNDRERILKNLDFARSRIAEASEIPAEPSVDSIVRAREATGTPVDHWRPDRPLAGTELMVEALRARLGSTLDAIDLRVNLYDPATRGARPLVVWFHHDVDQAAVRWCRDPALTDPVARFVFISYWQKERYVAAFGLRPERCEVIKYAMEPAAAPRRWEAAAVYRCAYTSTPFRGLDVLLDVWERVPTDRAELHVWSSMKLYTMDDGPYRHLVERARTMPGVVYHGLAPNAELRAALRTMHFLTYPNTFAETACLSVMEAMSAGCRVIVPSHGVLPETTGGYARVYPWSPDKAAHAAAFAAALEREFAVPWDGRPGEALDQQAHCATVFAWERRLGEWRRLIASLAAASAVVRQPIVPIAHEETSVIRALQRLRASGFVPGGIVDVGAHDGAFSRAARQVFPGARILMVEALPDKGPVLERVARDLGDATHRVALLGERDGETATLFVVDTGRRPDLVTTGSSMFRENSNFPMIELSMPQRRLDGVLDEAGAPCTLLKLDVQGAELSVLRGLGGRLSEVEVILTEMSLVAYNAGAPLMADVVSALAAWGFALLDLVEEHRHRDGRLLQVDGLFVRVDSPLRSRPPFWT